MTFTWVLAAFLYGPEDGRSGVTASAKLDT
jgi:hypothetical protein